MPKVKKDYSKTKIQKQVDDLIDVHNPSKETIDKLEQMLKQKNSEKDEGYIQLMKNEAEFWFYSPQNDKEETELRLLKMIRKRQDRILDLSMKIGAGKDELQRLALDKKVFIKVLASQTKQKKEQWQYNFSEDFVTMIKSRVAELEDEIDYEIAWVKQAEKLITTKRYKHLPDDYFYYNHFDYEGASIFEDDECDCCCSCCKDKKYQEEMEQAEDF